MTTLTEITCPAATATADARSVIVKTEKDSSPVVTQVFGDVSAGQTFNLVLTL